MLKDDLDLKAKRSRGRRSNTQMMSCFEKAYQWLEAEITVHSIPDFTKKVWEFSTSNEVYDSKYLKKLLKDCYGAHISFSDEPGKETLIYFLDMAIYLINEKFREKKEDVKDESTRIINLAANLIKAPGVPGA